MPAASCPRCGAHAPPQTARCQACGFAFFEQPRRRRLGPLRPLSAVLPALAVLLVVVGLVVLLSGDEPAAGPAPPDPVAAARAERELEVQFANAGYDDTAGVRCRRAVRLAGATRCHVRYTNGDTQLILVGLDGGGELEITIPYPAQRRPGN
jgi:hypothetical protein